jgi:hypothetical protein
VLRARQEAAGEAALSLCSGLMIWGVAGSGECDDIRSSPSSLKFKEAL